jgi:hypothetical protein
MITHAYTTDVFRIPQFGPSPKQRRAAYARTKYCSCGGGASYSKDGVVVNIRSNDQVEQASNTQAEPSTQPDQDDNLAGVLAILDYLKQLDARVAALESDEGAQSNTDAQPSSNGPMDRDGYLQPGPLTDPASNEPLSPSVRAAREQQLREAGGCAELSPFHYDNGQPIPPHEPNALKLMGSNPPGRNNNNLNGGLGNSAPPGGGPYAAAMEQSPREGDSNPRNSEALTTGPLGKMRRSPDQHDWVPKASQDQLGILPYAYALGQSLGSSKDANDLLPAIAAGLGALAEIGGAAGEAVGAFEPVGQAVVGGALGAASSAKQDTDDDRFIKPPAMVQSQGAGGDMTTKATTGDVVRVNRYLKSQLAPKRHAYNLSNPRIAAQVKDQICTAQSRDAEFARNKAMAQQAAAAYKRKG